MAGTDRPRFTLVGGGLGGALLAAYLGEAGYQVELYERRADPAAGNFVGGRSINLAISERGIHALRGVGLADEVLAGAIPMRGRMIHGPQGDLHFQPYDKDPARCINSIGRATLNSVTLAAAQKLPNVRVFFEHKCVDVDLDTPAAEIVDEHSGQTFRTRGDIVVGFDGAFSAVRRSLQRLERFEYSQVYLEHGYKELTIPPGANGGFQMERNALHIWPRRSFMMIALPNADGSFTCTLFRQFEGAQSFASLRSADDVRRFFGEQFPDAVPLMPTLAEDFLDNPTGSMVTVRCGPWHQHDKVLLGGDAAHAVVPFYGQGANASFEDCVVLDECIREFAPDWRRAFGEYYARRKRHADALADLALANFIEMRDHTGSRLFRARKVFERTLHGLLPGVYTPLYTMVSFTRIPYADAVQRAARQNRVIVVALAITCVALVTALLSIVQPAALALNLTVAAVVVYAVVQGMLIRWRRLERELRRVGAKLE